MTKITDFTVTDIAGESYPLSRYQGQALLIVNTASKCGFTPQFAGLEELYQTYRNQGFTILGFPCNQFLMQDPGSDQKIATFCQQNYGVSFPMHHKIKVNGAQQDPLYRYLIDVSGGANIKWNFTKFLIDQNGQFVQRFEPKETPASISPVLEQLLKTD